MENGNGFMIGNAFPLTLVRHGVHIRPVPLEEVREALQTRDWVSFWGHDNTLQSANQLLGTDITPREDRPVIRLQEAGLPTLSGKPYRQAYILSANYRADYRPAIGEEVGKDQITGWQALRMDWE